LAFAAVSQAQVTNVVFSENFGGPLNTNKLKVGTISLEGGTGNIKPAVTNGVVEFTGVVSQQWWPGGSLQTVQSFPVNAETNVVASVDRVQEIGGGDAVSDTAHRSALWVLDPTLSYFVLFAYNTENNWEYNFKIGSASDVATGSGTAIAAFNDSNGPFLDNALHSMKAVANGQTVQLYLDNTFGVEVPFPFSQQVYAIGSLARANNDVADTIFDNFVVQTVGLEAFAPGNVSLLSGQTVSNVVVRIPAGANSAKAVSVKVTSDTPAVAIPVGAVNGTATLTFAAGATNQQALSIQATGTGGAVFSLTNDTSIATANQLNVVVLQPAGVRLTDDFAGASLDATKWQIDTNGFESTGIGTYTVTQKGGQLLIRGATDQQSYWAGVSVKTVSAFTATPQLPLSFEMDRVGIDPTQDGTTLDTGARTGVYITTADRSKFVFFGQDVGETGWEVNINPGSPTGSGTTLQAFSSITDTNSHHMKLVADGSQVEVFLDGKSGGKFSFPVSAGILFEVGAYARAVGDAVTGVFDNVNVSNILPPVSLAATGAAQQPTSIETMLGVNTNTVLVTVPQLITSPLGVTITSQDPKVAVPLGAVNGALKLQFAPGAANTQTFAVSTVGTGATTFSATNDQALAMSVSQVGVSVISMLGPVFTDTFSSPTVDTNKNWKFDTTALDSTTSGNITADSGVSVTNGTLKIAVTADTGNWPGITLRTAQGYSATATAPVTFDVDRVQLTYVLVTGTGALERSGVWVSDSTGQNYVFLGEYVVHNSGTLGGWQYNVVTGGTNDTVLPGQGTVIQAFNTPAFNDQGNHHVKLEANGTNVKIYLDGVYGATVPFPFASNLTFGIGTYVAAATDIATGYFDNAVVSTSAGTPPTGGTLTATAKGNQVVISWTGTGTLQSTSTLASSGTAWADVTPPPSGNSYTVTPTAGHNQFYRLR
jgi:hypothetical protein